MKLFNKNIWLLVGVLALIESISFSGYFFEPLKIAAAIIISLIVVVLTFKNLENGLLILFAELTIGSKGHLFEIGPISIRMIIFAAIILAFVYNLRKREEQLKIYNYLKQFKIFAGLAFFILVSLIVAFINHNGLVNIYSDFNAWLFFLLLFPVLSVYYQAKKDVYKRLIQILVAAFLWLGFETFIILYVFTHNLVMMSDMYLWLRRTGVAEITPTLGSWPRIFLQSQIYTAIAIVILPFVKLKKINQRFLLILAWGVALLSMSRSFWLAIILSLAIGLLWILAIKGWKYFGQKLLLLSLTAISSVILIVFITIFPIPKPGAFSADSFINRVSLDSNEAAVASRWSLLPVMWHEIVKSPFLGYGFGKTITYKSSDPRVLQVNPSGEYTTYAFEWGYLGLWLKLGILGLLSYLSLLGLYIYRGLRDWRAGNDLSGALALGLVVLAIVHFLTPYLDHPLGIAYLIFAACLIEKSRSEKNKTLP